MNEHDRPEPDPDPRLLVRLASTHEGRLAIAIELVRVHLEDEMDRVKGVESGWPMVELGEALANLKRVESTIGEIARVRT